MLDGDVEFSGFIPLRECAQLNKTNEFPIILYDVIPEQEPRKLQ